MLFKKFCLLGSVYAMIIGFAVFRSELPRSDLTGSDLLATGGDYGWGWFTGTDCATVAGFVPTPCPQALPPTPASCSAGNPCLFPVFGQCVSGGNSNAGQYVCIQISYYLYDWQCTITNGGAICDSNTYSCVDDDEGGGYCGATGSQLSMMCGTHEDCEG